MRSSPLLLGVGGRPGGKTRSWGCSVFWLRESGSLAEGLLCWRWVCPREPSPLLLLGLWWGWAWDFALSGEDPPGYECGGGACSSAGFWDCWWGYQAGWGPSYWVGVP